MGGRGVWDAKPGPHRCKYGYPRSRRLTLCAHGLLAAGARLGPDDYRPEHAGVLEVLRTHGGE
jgi:hypothetical protein